MPTTVFRLINIKNCFAYDWTYKYEMVRGCNGRGSMVIGYTTTYAIKAYHH